MLDPAVLLQRALGRWVRSSIDKGRPAGAPSAAQPASEAPDGQTASRAEAAPVHSPFADLPASEPFPGRRPAPAPAVASEDNEQLAVSGEDNVRSGLSAGSQEEQSASASLQAMKSGAGQSQSVEQEHRSSAPFHSKSSMSSTQSTGSSPVISHGDHPAALQLKAHEHSCHALNQANQAVRVFKSTTLLGQRKVILQRYRVSRRACTLQHCILCFHAPTCQLWRGGQVASTS